MGWVLIHYQDTEAPLTADTALLAGPELWGGYRKKDKKIDLISLHISSLFLPIKWMNESTEVKLHSAPLTLNDKFYPYSLWIIS